MMILLSYNLYYYSFLIYGNITKLRCYYDENKTKSEHIKLFYQTLL